MGRTKISGKWHPPLGHKIGNLTVIDNSPSLMMNWKSPKPGALCRCDCGREFMAPILRLYTGQTFRCAACSHTIGNPRETVIKMMFNRYRRQAVERGYEFELTRPQFESLIFENCVYSGHEPKQTAKYKDFTLFYNGIDRVNNSLGYTLENSVTCCGICNRAKSGMTHQAWSEWLAEFRPCVLD